MLTEKQGTGHCSRSYFPGTSGVKQGCLLGPILFLLFVDDLPNTVKTSRTACYARDIKIFKSIDSITDCNALQSDLNDLVSWSESSGLILITPSVNASALNFRLYPFFSCLPISSFSD